MSVGLGVPLLVEVVARSVTVTLGTRRFDFDVSSRLRSLDCGAASKLSEFVPPQAVRNAMHAKEIIVRVQCFVEPIILPQRL